jgi:hypothetical protein
MHPEGHWKRSGSRLRETVALFSVGALEEKLWFSLCPLLMSSDLILSCYENYAYPRNLTADLIDNIVYSLRKKNIRSVIFDIRIHGWKDESCLKNASILSHSLQALCNDLRINNSFILSNGDLLIGNALGLAAEKREAEDVLMGDGPRDLTKFVLETGADFLLMTKRALHRIEAKMHLRDKIINGEFFSSPVDYKETTTLPSAAGGYVHHLVPDQLCALRSCLSSAHPELSLYITKKPGDWISEGDDIVEMRFPEGVKIPLDQELGQKIFAMSDTPPNHQPLILEKMGLNINS